MRTPEGFWSSNSADDEFLSELEVHECTTCHPSPKLLNARKSEVLRRAVSLMNYFGSVSEDSTELVEVELAQLQTLIEQGIDHSAAEQTT